MIYICWQRPKPVWNNWRNILRSTVSIRSLMGFCPNAALSVMAHRNLFNNNARSFQTASLTCLGKVIRFKNVQTSSAPQNLPLPFNDRLFVQRSVKTWSFNALMNWSKMHLTMKSFPKSCSTWNECLCPCRWVGAGGRAGLYLAAVLWFEDINSGNTKIKINQT